MIHIREIDHVVIRTANLDGLLRFYCEVLGCAVERRRDDLGLIQLRAGRSMIDLVTDDGKLGRMGGSAPGPEGRNMDHVSLRIEPFNIEDIRSHLSAFGVEYSDAQTNYGAEGNGPSIYVKDPDGNVVELKGPPDAKG